MDKKIFSLHLLNSGLVFFDALPRCGFLLLVLNSIPGNILKLQIVNSTLQSHARFPGSGEEGFGELIHLN